MVHVTEVRRHRYLCERIYCTYRSYLCFGSFSDRDFLVSNSYVTSRTSYWVLTGTISVHPFRSRFLFQVRYIYCPSCVDFIHTNCILVRPTLVYCTLWLHLFVLRYPPFSCTSIYGIRTLISGFPDIMCLRLYFSSVSRFIHQLVLVGSSSIVPLNTS